jgi:hypothetical protein
MGGPCWHKKTEGNEHPLPTRSLWGLSFVAAALFIQDAMKGMERGTGSAGASPFAVIIKPQNLQVTTPLCLTAPTSSIRLRLYSFEHPSQAPPAATLPFFASRSPGYQSPLRWHTTCNRRSDSSRRRFPPEASCLRARPHSGAEPLRLLPPASLSCNNPPLVSRKKKYQPEQPGVPGTQAFASKRPRI